MADKLRTAHQGVAEASLKRLKTDVIALFYQPRSIHRVEDVPGINEQEIGIYSL